MRLPHFILIYHLSGVNWSCQNYHHKRRDADSLGHRVRWLWTPQEIVNRMIHGGRVLMASWSKNFFGAGLLPVWPRPIQDGEGLTANWNEDGAVAGQRSTHRVCLDRTTRHAKLLEGLKVSSFFMFIYLFIFYRIKSIKGKPNIATSENFHLIRKYLIWNTGFT